MRFIEIDSIKALAIIGVLIAHMSFDSRFDEETLTVVKGAQALFGWCVLAFFFCSGMVAKSIVSVEEVRDYIRRRIVRLVLPCVIFSVSYKLIRCGIYLTGRFDWESPLPTTFVESLYFILVPIGPQFYFLYYLFMISIGIVLLNLVLPKKHLFWVSGFLLVIFYGFICAPARAYGPELSLIPLYMFSYICGMVSSDGKLGGIWASLLCLLPVVIVILISRSLIVGYVAIPYLLGLFFRRLPLLTQGIEKMKLGKYSSAIYVWHAPLIMPLWSMICVRLLGSSIWVLIPMIGCTIVCCICLGEIVTKFHVFRFWRF